MTAQNDHRRVFRGVDWRPLRILVTDTQELSGLGTVRSLGRAGHTVTASFPSGYNPASAYSRYCAATLTYPDPWLEHHAFRAWMTKVLRNNAFDAVFPVAEAAVFATAALRKDLPKDVLLLLPSDEHLHTTLSKYHTCHIAQEAEVPIAKTVFVSNAHGHWQDDLSSLQFPIVIKTDNVLTSKGIYRKGKCSTARTPDEAHDILEQYRPLGTRIIAQEFIVGSGLGTSMLRWEGDIKLSFSYRRLHEVPWTGGASSLRESRHNAKTEEYAQKILSALNYQGIAMVEFREDHKTRQPYLVEINGRPWGSIALSQHAGIEFPAAIVDCALTGSIHPCRSQKHYPDGLRCRNFYPGEVRHLFSVLKAVTRPGLPPSPSKLQSLLGFVLLSLNPTIHQDIFWWTDPRPLFRQLVIMFGDLKGGFVYRLGTIFQQRRNRKILRQAWRQHQQRLKQKRYFSFPPKRLLFLCHGNIYRSPFAETMWKQLMSKDGHVSSAGFHSDEGRETSAHMQPLLKTLGADLSTHRSKKATKEMIDHADVLCIMDLRNWRSIAKEFPHALPKTVFLGLFSGDEDIEIKDPHKLESPQARESFEKIKRSLEGLAKVVD